MKILVTGANGLLGNKLVELLLNEDVELIATSRGESRFRNTKGFLYHSMDISQSGDIREVFHKTKPDVVINTAALTQVDDCETQRDACWSLNVESVGYLIDACRDIDAFFIQLSTDFIFSGEAGPLDEEAQPAPVNFYGESKLAAEKLIQKSSIRWAIARTVLVYGITSGMSRSNIILWVKSKLENGEEIRVVNDQFRTPTLAEDLAMGCYLIAKKQATGIYNISGKDFLTPYEMAIQTADFFGLDKSLIIETNSREFTQTARRPLITGFKIDKARKKLGYNPRSFEEGIRLISAGIRS